MSSPNSNTLKSKFRTVEPSKTYNQNEEDDIERIKERIASKSTSFSSSSSSLSSSLSRSSFSFIISAIYLVLIIIISLITSVISFNLENRLPIIKYGQPGSYFGYSVAEHIIGEIYDPENEKLLLVGAPLGKNYQPGTNRSGALFKCPITQRYDDCEQIITDGRRLPGGRYESYDRDEPIENLVPPITSEEIKEDQWLGVTVRSQGLGGKVLVCAHRYIVVQKAESQYGQGLCYLLSNELKFDEIYEPCKGRSVQRAHEDYGYCQVGTSGALLEDNSMVLGTPGPYTWRGTIFVTEIGGEYLERDKNIYYSDHTEYGSPVDKYSYLGMAVTGGRYFGSKMYYAAGAPRSNGHGQVIIFTKSKKSPMPVQMIIDGEQFASSFGYELITADVNGDQMPDLIVAAPFYFSKSEGGAVYVYQNEKDQLPSKPTLKLTGTLESRFGISLANIGDINKDTCDDIAIGAPYEGDGVVYIYLGGGYGLSSKPSQIITASSLGKPPIPINTFGISVAGGIDLDGNLYPDIVIGAYNSSTVVALLARPIINIRTEVKSSELNNIDPNKSGCLTDVTTNLTCFSFEACCAINPYEDTPKELQLVYTIEAETFGNARKFSRVFFGKDYSKRSNLITRSIVVKANGRLTCNRETTYIKENTRDIQSPIKFHLNYTIVEKELPNSGLEYLNPILDQTQADRDFEGIFQKDCGNDDKCVSDIRISVETDLDKENNEYALIIGETEELRVNVTVTNLADSAYEAQLFIVHQKSVNYIASVKGSSVICNRFNETVVSCYLGNPMKRDTSVQIAVRFNPSELDDSENQIFFNIFANTTSTIEGGTPFNGLSIRVIKKADLSIQGWARPEQSFYGGEIKGESAMEYLEDIGTPVTHTYQIFNDGPWKAPHVKVTIHWPHQVANDKKQGKWLLYLESLPVVEGRQGQCFISSDLVNPLKLTKRPLTTIAPPTTTTTTFTEIAPESYMLRSSSPHNKSVTYTSSSSNKNSFRKSSSSSSDSSSSSSTSSSDTRRNRVRRDQAKIIRAERLIDKDGKKTDIVVMDCEKETAFCITIVCDIFNMLPKSESFVVVQGRLWNSTLVGDYPRVDIVKIISRAQIHIPDEYKVEQSNPNNKAAVETTAFPELLDQIRDSSTPIWVIILAVLGGLLVLAILIIVMWKCGFFKRRRPDPTLSGNLEKNSENKPFIQK